ncbi:hypothetical protein ASPWEDRAFT_171618 [Aspergillus wentii DTO 134E9]|uniref:Fungal-type protein kinase domain-containing protein n=1 Tax=Aspergillus wentii DTO 134E9 TaxID=1073089 RepID=A0A1L9RIT1_ASPWE|nr:uncharacterized protein ASPWEDRAFT_171618 [Aspergillus wentii DTO 134E9]KAI9932256.1 hypothetical protein MW887_009767 [Aspergillus wentii]OJJ34783.1 hypothetical protein ASPWEDRAFT_171618 [Aspergillus wentii DTO 134E9]
MAKSKEPGTSTPLTLLIKNPSEKEILSLLTLKRDKRPDAWKLSKKGLIEASSYLVSSLENFDQAWAQSLGLSKARTQQILISCFAAEGKTVPQQPTSSKPGFLGGLRNFMCHMSLAGKATRNGWPSLRCDTTVRYEIESHSQCKLILSAKTENSFWHRGSEKMGPSLVVAIKQSVNGQAKDHCLAYMAMVHRIRKEAGNTNVAVYGIVTDGYIFSFIQIDHESKVSKSDNMHWNSDSRANIITHIRLFLRKTIQMAPLTKQKPLVAFGPRFRFTGEELKDGRGSLDGEDDEKTDVVDNTLLVR